jgi:hypothetical protein
MHKPTYQDILQDTPELRQRLEPRVAKLEVGLDRLTDDVKELSSIVRQQGANTDSQIQRLIVAVTEASAPKKTDWPTLIALIMLVMAIGSAVFWPLNQTAQENKVNLERLSQKVEEHQKESVQADVDELREIKKKLLWGGGK